MTYQFTFPILACLFHEKGPSLPKEDIAKIMHIYATVRTLETLDDKLTFLCQQIVLNTDGHLKKMISFLFPIISEVIYIDEEQKTIDVNSFHTNFNSINLDPEFLDEMKHTIMRSYRTDGEDTDMEEDEEEND